jgi:ADP-heptose:LPS heptosyltransferase
MNKFSQSLLRLGQRFLAEAFYFKRHATPRDPHSVVVIRTDGIGDFILWLSFAKAIRNKYPSPDYKLTLVAPDDLHDLIASMGLFDEILPFNRRAFESDHFYSAKLLNKISSLRATVAINPQVSRYQHSDRMMRASGAEEIIGFDGDRDTRSQSQKKRNQHSKWYSKLIHTSQNSHDIESNILFARVFDTNFEDSYPSLEVGVFTFPEWIPRNDYFVIQPRSGSVAKQWPIERFLEIARKLISETGWTAVICGSEDDHLTCATFSSFLPDAIDASGKATLRDLCGLLSGAKLAIANDSGPAHIAAAVNCPVILPFGGWHFGRFFPYPRLPGANPPHQTYPVFKTMECFNCSWVCKFERGPSDAFHCLKIVSVDDVWSVVSILLPAQSKMA